MGLLVSTEAMSANTLGLWASTLDSLENTGETKMNIVVKSDYIVEKWDCIAVMTANIAGKMVNISARWVNTWATLDCMLDLSANILVRLESNWEKQANKMERLGNNLVMSGYTWGCLENKMDSVVMLQGSLESTVVS